MRTREMSKQEKIERIERFIRGAWSSTSRDIAQSLLEQVNGAEEMATIKKLYKEAAVQKPIKHRMTLFGYVGRMPHHAGSGLGKLFRELYPGIEQAAEDKALGGDFPCGYSPF